MSIIIPKFMTIQTVKQIIMKPLFPNISRSKGNQTMVFYQSIEYNMRYNFPKKSYLKWGVESGPRAFYKKSKLTISLD